MELFAKTFGDAGAPAVILLHGLFGASTNWGSIARSLATDYRLIVPDLRNHGQSPHTPDHDYPTMVQDVVELMDANNLQSAAVVGHSMGGKVAMHLALNHADRVDRLAVVDIAPVSYAHDFDDVLAGFAAVDLATVNSRSDADAQMRSMVSVEGVRAFLLQNLVKRDDGWDWRLNLDALALNAPSIAGFPDQRSDACYERATLFVYGDQSHYVRTDYRNVIEAYFPHADYCPVSGAGHWVYADRPQAFMDCLSGFLN